MRNWELHIIKPVLVIIFGFCMAIHGHAQPNIPDAPVFESASVVPGTDPAQVVLSWLSSDSVDVDSYIIYEVEDGITQASDTVVGRLTTSFTDSSTIAADEPVTYRLAASDSLENLSKLTDPHSTMHVVTDYEICDLEITVDWTEYVGWDDVDHYDVYRKTEGGSYNSIKTVSGNKTEYVDDNLDPFVNYCYYIEAVRSDDITAKSNQQCVFTSSYVSPAWLNADYASVENENIELRFTVDTSGEVDSYDILRARDSAYAFSEIHSQQNNNEPRISYTDTDVEPSTHKYYYKLQSIDPCGNVSEESNISSNLMLDIESDKMLNHHLAWDDYETYRGGVQEYRIFRHFGYEAPKRIAINDIDENEFSNNISDYVKKKHDKDEIVPHIFCYYVEAVEEPHVNPAGVQGVSRSNEVCVTHRPRSYVPNTFYPNSYEETNTLFKPVVTFAKEAGYEFIVFDRWGNEIFRTEDPQEAWDGSTTDRMAPPGKYVFYLRYLDHQDKEYVKSGAFLLYNE
ncbi:MAG: gliding motility-associated C-terminal domain-containing protein [Bacteroidales bacterium]